MLVIDDVQLGKKYNININIYNGQDLDFCDLKTRTVNCLKEAGILTFTQLFATSFLKLSNIKNLGKGTLEDIEKYMMKLEKKVFNSNSEKRRRLTLKIIDRRERIYQNDFGEDIFNGLTIDECDFLNKCKAAFGIIDSELLNDCANAQEKVLSLLSMFEQFNKSIALKKQIRGKLSNIKESKLNNRIEAYIEIFCIETESWILKESFQNKEMLLRELMVYENSEPELLKEIDSFVGWVEYDLKYDLSIFLEACYKRSKNAQFILEMRAKKNTLNAVGEALGITRERVRQIERKIVELFHGWQKKHKFLLKLSADFSGATIVEAIDLQEHFGELTEVLLYLLQCADDETFSCDKQTDTIIIVNDDLTDKAKELVGKLPNEFEQEDLWEIVLKGQNEYNIPENILLREVSNQYQLSGSHYHKTKLTLTRIYSLMLKKYYPDGMDIYDENELEIFREYIYKEFGNINIPKNNRALSAGIAREAILCGRGRYKVKEEKYISCELEKKIYEYIFSNNRTIFLTNSIFTEFEDELIEQGIDNRYYLQGVLRECFEDKLFFRRDYVSKDSNNLSIYRDIVLFIKRSQFPVTKAQIREAYPGITEIVISLAVSDENILNYLGAYLHVSNLKLYDSDKAYFRKIIDRFVKCGIPQYNLEIYEYIERDNPDLLKKLGVFFQYSLFSLLEYLFRGEYEFLRPYIASKGICINKPVELIEEYILANEIVEIAEILDKAKELHYQILDILKFINSWNSSHIMINKEEMGTFEYIGITQAVVEDVEEKIFSEITETMPIANLKCIYQMPELKVPWTEWLIYSVINKWGVRLEVNTTSNQFRSAIPVISKIGQYNPAVILDIDVESSVVQIDDLDNIDMLISGYILDDMGEV